VALRTSGTAVALLLLLLLELLQTGRPASLAPEIAPPLHRQRV
jgi:hypothetical protein